MKTIKTFSFIWSIFDNWKKSKNQIYIHSLSEVNRGLIFSSKNFNLLTNWKTWTGWAHNNSQTFLGSLGGCISFSSSKTGWCFSKYLKDKSKQTTVDDIRVIFDLFQIKWKILQIKLYLHSLQSLYLKTIQTIEPFFLILLMKLALEDFILVEKCNLIFSILVPFVLNFLDPFCIFDNCFGTSCSAGGLWAIDNCELGRLLDQKKM